MAGVAGELHAELDAGPECDRIYLGQPPGDFRNPANVGRTSQLYVLVAEADAHYEGAKAAGAKIIEELNDSPAGHRRYGCADPQGHEWCFAQPIES
jgi:uncharacterized glyoxalase superfamily protein PhnB